MRIKILLSLFISMFLLFSFNAQTPPLNIQQISHVPTTSFIVPSELNDIWGWVDNQGKEYAIIGTNDGTSIFDLSNPSSPQEVFFEPGMNSVWRDVKTYGNYAYVTTEAMNGLLIIDLSNLPDSAKYKHILLQRPIKFSMAESSQSLY